jgi:hypothetical protein
MLCMDFVKDTEIEGSSDYFQMNLNTCLRRLLKILRPRTIERVIY